MDTSNDRVGLLRLAALCVVGMIAIGLVAIFHTIETGAATLIGVIAAGLATGFKDIVTAIRGYSMSSQLSKVTDQLAASAPTSGEPQPVRVTNGDDDAVPVQTA